MFCKHCGKQLKEGAKFCTGCGTPTEQAYAPQPATAPTPQPTKPKRRLHPGVLTAIIAGVLVLALASTWLVVTMLNRDASTDRLADEDDRSSTVQRPSRKDPDEDDDAQQTPDTTTDDTEDTTDPQDTALQDALAVFKPLVRPQLLSFTNDSADTGVTASVAPYTVQPGLANVTNANQFYLTDEETQLLTQNLFVVSKDYNNEFFERYEQNRYLQIPNFVTVDSMMHTYHLYFSLLLNRTEKNYLAADLLALSEALLQTSISQYEVLIGTEWEEAAQRNVAFFAVAAALQSPSVSVPEPVHTLAQQELDAIYAANGIAESLLAGDYMDYSQFKPRGYYEGDEVLEQYFRAMMWYGQVNFTQQDDSLHRSALLMTLAMAETDLHAWEQIYIVTSFFAGASDDLGYYEYAPAIEAAYGTMPSVFELPDNDAAYQTFTALTAQMEPPAINSVPVWEGTEDISELKKGFRFMGQRFTIDAAIMQQLVYSNVKENSSGERRMLPDTLDVPAAFGSDMALQILTEQGATEYSGYMDNMQELRATLDAAPEDSWATSLYASWLYTLEPLLTVKGEGYPSFMTSEQWQKKDLETFAGSFTELKHDTVLYAKQMMAEMGGGPMEVIDDRGYVQPEVEVYRRFMQLAQQTSDGLLAFGLIDSVDVENLTRLADLAQYLVTISEKELLGEPLTDEEYDLIRCYGGTLEHFWVEAVKDKSESPWLDAKEIPASLVTDIATDPNGTVLQVATGKPAEILVIVPIDGQLRIASGVVFDFYQFEQPIDQRLTDTEWRQLIGEWMMDDGTYNWDAQVEKPWWTQSYWSAQ